MQPPGEASHHGAGKTVSMVGDGVNAPALFTANVGIPKAAGMDVAMEAGPGIETGRPERPRYGAIQEGGSLAGKVISTAASMASSLMSAAVLRRAEAVRWS